MAVCQSSTNYPYWCNHWNYLNTEERIKHLVFEATFGFYLEDLLQRISSKPAEPDNGKVNDFARR